MVRRTKYSLVQHQSVNHFFKQQGAYWVCIGTAGTNGCGLALTGLQLRALKNQRCPGPKAKPIDIMVGVREA